MSVFPCAKIAKYLLLFINFNHFRSSCGIIFEETVESRDKIFNKQTDFIEGRGIIVRNISLILRF